MRNRKNTMLFIGVLAFAGTLCCLLLVISGSRYGKALSVEALETVCFSENGNQEKKLELIFVYENKSYVFTPNYSGLSDAEKKKRGAGCLDVQLELIGNIIELGLDEETALNYVFPSFSELLKRLDKELSVKPHNAEASFIRDNDEIKVKIEKCGNGKELDRGELCALTIMKLKSGVNRIKIPMKTLFPERDEECLKRETYRRGEFYTYCNIGNIDRLHNIKLALSALDGLKLPPGETFSFNGTVGERSEKRGYRIAGVINRGEYAEGVGGGVCQVATTVYNAALKAGLQIIERNRHTLRSSYVEAGFDAMVSYGGADLRIKNNTDGNIYLICDITEEGRITTRFFGEENPYRIERESVIDEDYGHGSVKSSSYLVYYLNDTEIKRERIHGDYYYPAPKY